MEEEWSWMMTSDKAESPNDTYSNIKRQQQQQTCEHNHLLLLCYLHSSHDCCSFVRCRTSLLALLWKRSVRLRPINIRKVYQASDIMVVTNTLISWRTFVSSVLWPPIVWIQRSGASMFSHILVPPQILPSTLVCSNHMIESWD